MSKCVITGGAGFIGSNLVRRLIGEGYEVTVIDNLSTGRIDNISDVLDEVRFVQGDIRDLDLLKLEFQGAEVIFHQAALPSVPRSIADPISTNSNNIDGTLNVMVAAKECRVIHVVLASSSSVYGDTEILPKTENMVANPLSPYAVTKYVGEIYAKVFAELYGLRTVCLRYFNVFGPYQDPNSQYAAVIPKFINLMIKGERPVIYGDGEQSRDFTYVDNVVEANLLAVKVRNVSSDVINIGCGKRFTLNHLVEVLNELLGASIEPEYKVPRPGDVRHSMASIDKAREVLGYDPPVSFEEGLERTVSWIREKIQQEKV